MLDGYIKIRAVWFIVLSCILGLSICAIVFLSLWHRYRRSQLLGELNGRTEALEEQIEKAKEAVQAKSNFLSRMSHEIRTPLNAVIGMAQIAQNTTDLDKIHDCMDKMEDNSRHLMGIINDILDFSKIESGNLVFEETIFSLVHEIDFIASMFKTKVAEKNLTLRLKIVDIRHDGIVTDKLRLNQVLINLISNAVKFTDPGGVIELAAEELLHMEGESVFRFTVRDNGIGIEPEQAKKLFTPFSQANAGISRLYGGTGLGLAISQNIVQHMGGDIELDTEPGIGTAFQFTIRVPAKATAGELPKYESSTALPDRLQGKRILIVDDVEINREIAEALLDGSGALIETAADGKEALDAFCNAEPYWYDLILMDMMMPIMDGCTATKEIRNSGKEGSKDVKIIAMTANVLKEDVERAYQSGMNGHLAKPIDLTELSIGMEEWL